MPGSELDDENRQPSAHVVDGISESRGNGGYPMKKLDYRVASVALLVVAFWSVGTYSQGSAPPPLPQGNSGIAAGYPNDAGISANPNVLFADAFESYTSPSQLTSSGNYSNYYATQNFAIDTSTFFAGGKSVRMRMPASGVEISGGLVRNISPKRDSMYMRVYTRFQPNYAGLNSAHNGLRITGGYTGPGVTPNGHDFFLVNIENPRFLGEGEPGYTHAYVYHPEKTDAYGESWYSDGHVTNGSFNFGPFFVPRPNVNPTRGVWICYEMYVQMNTPGVRDGRVAAWMDGVLVGDWQNIRFRDVTTVKIDQIELDNGGQGSTQQNDKWYDNLVIASSYVGPMVSGTTAPTPPINLRIIR
jgi:hypothetical protein